MKSSVENLLQIIQRQALHAKKLCFIHPHSRQKVFFDSELPDDIELLIDNLRT